MIAAPSPLRRLAVLRTAGVRFWLETAVWAVGIALAIGIPTVLIDNSLFRRMTPTRPWDFALWGAAAALGGLTLAARRLPRPAACRVEGRVAAGGGLTYLAVACPVCNKIVVALLGASGATTWFAPVQPILGLAGVALLAVALLKALDGAGEPVPAP